MSADQILSGIGLTSNASARFAAPETISAQGALRRRAPRGYNPEQHLEDMASRGGRRSPLSLGLFYFKVSDRLLISANFRAYNEWLAEFCRTDPSASRASR
jgi:hypothetical protein